MFVDTRTLADGHTIEADICILGAGPAGLTMASEFNGTGTRVVVLEAGGFEFDEATASLTDGEVSGDPFSPLRDMRHRQFGGLSSTWNIILHTGRIGVRYVPLDPIDFELRDWLPNSGWPITYDDLVPYYHRAHEVCQLGEFNYSPDPWETDRQKRISFGDNSITTTMFKFGPSDVFYKQHRDDLGVSSNVAVYLHANAVELDANEAASTVQCVHAACLNGKRISVKSRIFVLATGGMENARLLLASNRRDRNGLGNRHDVVGRYFMDHPLVDFGMLFPYRQATIAELGLYDKKRINGETVMGRYSLNEAVLRSERLFAVSALIYPRDKRFRSEAKRSAKILADSLKRAKLPSDFFTHAFKALKRPHFIIGDWYRYNVKKEMVKPNLAFGEWSLDEDLSRFVKLELMAQTEQAPRPDNRVTLSRDVDRLGVPRVKLINHWHEEDIQNVRRAQQIFAKAFEQNEMGRLVIEDLPRPGAMMSTHHNMGTTRMHHDPRRGVVDADCRVHGLSNLYVAGSSVFTTGGYANPTLTIVALSIRLADLLKKNPS